MGTYTILAHLTLLLRSLAVSLLSKYQVPFFLRPSLSFRGDFVRTRRAKKLFLSTPYDAESREYLFEEFRILAVVYVRLFDTFPSLFHVAEELKNFAHTECQQGRACNLICLRRNW